MNNPESRLSAYIDALNAEKQPKEHLATDDPEMEKLMATVRLVRTLKEPALPDAEFPQRLAKTVADSLQAPQAPAKSNNPAKRKWYSFSTAVALVAGLLLIVVLANWGSFFNHSVVYAMEQAVAQLSNYHGVLEIRSRNAEGEEWINSQVELWYVGDKYALRHSDGTVTVNNGERKWQIRPQNKEIVLLPAVPDPTRDNFDLRQEAKRAAKYPHAVLGTEIIAGRQTTKLEISPPGGLAYHLWIDDETNLPIQLQTALQNALQTTYTFVSFEPNTKIDEQIFDYRPPAEYAVIEDSAGQLVATMEEAVAISKLTPLLPKEVPKNIIAFSDRIVLDYGNTVIIERAAKGDFKPAANAVLGTAAGGRLEVLSKQLRWRQAGIEIQVEGSRRVELARQIAGDLTFPDAGNDLAGHAQVKVPVDLEIVKANQQQVDRGSSPWQLDPLQVSVTFVNLKVTPEGVVGAPTVPEQSFKIVANNGVHSVVEVSNAPIKRVYLERILRQDESGIWTVIGYDPL